MTKLSAIALNICEIKYWHVNVNLMLTNIRLISVKEYHQMAETGIFHPEERL
ncbi:hypothetical protein LC605_12380 [Nostoc sp. CHAB 5836]|uniref:hypothetical protein n=1 Tax=Nostoc sp. CHAB 5836 TaxID=2780404 RepID=UPI001E45D41A|nr:hypothetical protein [Nostoc sp. CHAB 5836]MCC5615851.1 hypothetical protein [Nostoc sp. CHAB 5836]